MTQKFFLQFQTIFMSAIFLNTISGLIMMQFVFSRTLFLILHILTGILILLSFCFLLITKKGHNTLSIILNMTRPSLKELKSRQFFLYAFKSVNLLLSSTIIIQLISGLILSFKWQWLNPSVYQIHRLLTPLLIFLLIFHSILAIFSRKSTLKHRGKISASKSLQ